MSRPLWGEPNDQRSSNAENYFIHRCPNLKWFAETKLHERVPIGNSPAMVDGWRGPLPHFMLCYDSNDHGSMQKMFNSTANVLEIHHLCTELKCYNECSRNFRKLIFLGRTQESIQKKQFAAYFWTSSLWIIRERIMWMPIYLGITSFRKNNSGNNIPKGWINPYV